MTAELYFLHLLQERYNAFVSSNDSYTPQQLREYVFNTQLDCNVEYSEVDENE